MREHGRLHDAVALPGVFPEELAVGWRDAHHASCIQEQNLIDPIDRCKLRGAVTPAAGGADPERDVPITFGLDYCFLLRSWR